jgi:caspase domain-containing protein
MRLYHNDVPVRDGEGFERDAKTGELVTKLQLVSGDNRIYAMAERPGDVDARSEDLTLFHTGEASLGRLHVVALGVSKYERNELRYPHLDAKALAEFLEKNGLGAKASSGRTRPLIDDAVNEKAVELAFEKVRNEVRGHPEDTVVVFLAGHTDLLADGPDRSRFCLLLPSFPFPENAPARALLRGAGIAGEAVVAPPGTFLPYATIYHHLIRLDALQRLVIIDACQAEAILDDPGVRVVEQLRAMDREARQTRTNYFLASRRGEAAGESPVLEHGLLTYVLLRGMGAPDLKPTPDDLLAFKEHPSADSNGDGRVTTGELRRYVELTLPALAGRLPGMLRSPRSGNLQAPPTPARSAPRLFSAEASFPLVALPASAPTAGAAAGK